MEEPTEEESIETLKGLRKLYEKHHHVQITDEGVEASVRLSARYVNDRFLPDKAIDLIDEAAAKARLGMMHGSDEMMQLNREIHQTELDMEHALQGGRYRESPHMERDTGEPAGIQGKTRKKRTAAYPKTKFRWWAKMRLSMWWLDGQKIPVSRLTESEASRLQKLEETLHKRVIGQEEAVSAVSRLSAVVAWDSKTRSVRSVRFCFWDQPVSERRKFQSTGRGCVWQRGIHDPGRYVGVYGKAQCIQNDWLPARICEP